MPIELTLVYQSILSSGTVLLCTLVLDHLALRPGSSIHWRVLAPGATAFLLDSLKSVEWCCGNGQSNRTVTVTGQKTPPGLISRCGHTPDVALVEHDPRGRCRSRCLMPLSGYWRCGEDHRPFVWSPSLHSRRLSQFSSSSRVAGPEGKP